MTPAARRVLNAALTLPACEGFPADGWEHYFTGMGDGGCGTFAFDRAPEDGDGRNAGWITADTYHGGAVVTVREAFYERAKD